MEENKVNEIQKEDSLIDFSKKDKLISILIKILLVILACILSFILLAAITHTAYFFKCMPSDPVETMHYSKDNIFVNIVFSFLLASILLLAKRVLNKV